MGIPTEQCNICGGRWCAGDFDECPQCSWNDASINMLNDMVKTRDLAVEFLRKKNADLEAELAELRKEWEVFYQQLRLARKEFPFHNSQEYHETLDAIRALLNKEAK